MTNEQIQFVTINISFIFLVIKIGHFFSKHLFHWLFYTFTRGKTIRFLCFITFLSNRHHLAPGIKTKTFLPTILNATFISFKLNIVEDSSNIFSNYFTGDVSKKPRCSVCLQHILRSDNIGISPAGHNNSLWTEMWIVHSKLRKAQITLAQDVKENRQRWYVAFSISRK